MFFSILSSVQDWCTAAQVVTAGGSAGLLWCSVGQHAGQPHGATSRLRLYSHTLWPHGVPAPANTHARLRPQTRGEFLRLSYCTLVVQVKLNNLMGLFFVSWILLSFLASVCLQVKSVCLSLQDSNLLVQRNMLEVLLYFFPFAELLVGTHINTHFLYLWTTSLILSVSLILNMKSLVP